MPSATAAMAPSRDKVAYDEDYDQFNSHMTPSSMQSQDYEELNNLEMIQHEDVETSDVLRVSDGATQNPVAETMDSDGNLMSCYNCRQLEDTDYMELEEDWEIMHQSLQKGNHLSFEVCENIDDA